MDEYRWAPSGMEDLAAAFRLRGEQLPATTVFRWADHPSVGGCDVGFAPGQLSLDAGGTLAARNRGGEVHTFTEVATFGGGCIEALNDLLGLTPVPECAGFPGGAFAATRGFQSL